MDWRNARVSAGIGPGWEPLVDELHAKIVAHDPEVIVDQVKEKFGGLRYYFTPVTVSHHLLAPIVHEYELKASRTCEWCGQPGKEVAPQMRWLKTLCDEHAEAWASGKRWWDWPTEERRTP